MLPLEDILFSLNSVLPLFVLGVSGYLLVQRGVVDRRFADQASNLCFKLLIPFSLFREVYNARLLEQFNGRLVLFCVLTVLAVQLLAVLIWPVFIRDRVRCGACIHSTFRSNIVLMGIPLMSNMFGSEGSLVAAMVMPFVVILFNIGAVTTFTVFAPDSAGVRLSPAKLLRDILKNPFIIAILLGLAAQLSGLAFPGFVTKSVDYLAGMSTPLALIAVGGQFDPRQARGNLRLDGIVCFVRLVLVPGIATTLAALLGFRGAELAVVFVLFGSPTAVSGAALAKVMGGDYQITGEVTMLSSLFSEVTMFIGVSLLRSLALS